MSQQAVWDAIKTAVDAKFTAPRVLDLDEAAAVTTDHIVLWVSRRYTADQMLSGEVRAKGGRIVIRSVCKSPDNVRVFRERIEAALESKTLPGDIGPFVFESETDVNDEDDPWFVGSTSYTY